MELKMDARIIIVILNLLNSEVEVFRCEIGDACSLKNVINIHSSKLTRPINFFRNQNQEQQVWSFIVPLRLEVIEIVIVQCYSRVA